MAKTEGLRQNNGNFSGQILLNDTSSEDLKWWITNLQKLFHMVKQISLSKLMHLPKVREGCWGKMDPTEASNHINYLELSAISLSLKALCSAYTGSHIQVQCDNTTAVCYINNMGGSKSTPVML